MMKNITIQIDENSEKEIGTFVKEYQGNKLDEPYKSILYIMEEIHQQILIPNEKPYKLSDQGRNTIAVETEYSRWLVTKFRKMGGKWDKKEKVWKLKSVQIREMEKLLNDYYDKSIIELEFNAKEEIDGCTFTFRDIYLLEDSRDEYGRVDGIELAKDVTLIEGDLPKYKGPRSGHGSLVFEKTCKIRAEIPKFLLDCEDLDFKYGSFKIIE